MNGLTNFSIPSRGSSLIETVIAMGVLAVAIPLVFGALAESGKSTISSEAETRSTWIVPICMAEILASREGRPQFFSTTKAGEVFPPSSEVWAIAFTSEGRPVGKLSKEIYTKGSKELNGQPISYIATINANTTPTPTGAVPMLRAKITLEFPAAVPATRRQKIDFYSRIP